MIEQQGRVISTADGLAEIRLGGTAGCAMCDAGKGCGAGILGRLFKRKPVTVRLENRVSARSGQPVMVGIPEALYLRLVVRLYLYPLLSGLVGAMVGHYLSGLGGLGGGGTDAITLLAGIASGAAVIHWTRTGVSKFPESLIIRLLRVIEVQHT